MSDARSEAELPYGALDRALHRCAFASRDMQRALAEIEGRMFAGRIDLAAATDPVFVTSLPRAGTTVLLRILAALPDFASATYRQMPFPLSPLLWSQMTGRLRRAGEETERAHGDGLGHGYDSPEAFEEPAWMAFWPDHYRDGAIMPWQAGAEADEFAAFLRRHMAKIVAAGGAGARRYLSKNNANIARLGLIERMFPSATILVPVRQPWAQVASLLNQHRRFLDLHRREPFGRRYMEWLGHFEFGEALRPIGFGGRRPEGDPQTPEFWLRYWCAAYRCVLQTAGERAVLIDHDAFSAAPGPLAPALARRLSVDPAALAQAADDLLKPQRPDEPPEAPAALIDEARDIHAALLDRALAPEDAPATMAGHA